MVIGDTVQTSGEGGIFPKGIMIGTVERVMIEENGMDNYAVIRPFVDPATVTDVYVITDVTSGQVTVAAGSGGSRCATAE